MATSNCILLSSNDYPHMVAHLILLRQQVRPCFSSSIHFNERHLTSFFTHVFISGTPGDLVSGWIRIPMCSDSWYRYSTVPTVLVIAGSGITETKRSLWRTLAREADKPTVITFALLEREGAVAYLGGPAPLARHAASEAGSFQEERKQNFVSLDGVKDITS
jgi:hypothetical protein